jgi:hypothetical protein
MPRALSSSFLAATQSTLLRPALFIEAHFISGPLYVWSGFGSIFWNSQAWTGIGSLGSVSTIEEGSGVEAKGITLTMSGIDATLLADVLGEFQVGLPAIVSLGLFDSTGALIADPVTSWAGRMDQPTIDVDGTTATIAINCESRLLDMNVAVDRRYTNEDQQLDHPGDRGIEFVNSIQEVVIYWGRSPSSSA